MDLIATVQQQLESTTGLASLQLQNHIYGCFLLMEDIAQQIVILSGDQIQGKEFQFDVKQDFSSIGLRYGFVLDTKLRYSSYLPTYQEAWLAVFHQLAEQKQVEKVDQLEDALISMIRTVVPASEAFFTNALGSGNLPQAWIQKVLSLLEPKTEEPKTEEPKTEEPKTEEPKTEEPKTEEPKAETSVIQTANIEKNPVKKRFSTTRRNRVLFHTKKRLATTQRKKCV
jgi:hypothetical protein